MSALAGFWRMDGGPDCAGSCARMMAAQKIYGPHDSKQWSDGALAMGRQLYRMLPEDGFDRGPLTSRDGRLTLVADLRLDNRDELASELDLPLGQASRLSDTAILMESLERWGAGAVARLVGDFAFALWDSQRQEFLLARDFLGKRPLHYHRGRGFFAFASMPKGLHALPEIPYRVDEEIIAQTLVLMPPDHTRSVFRDVACVEPASILTVTREDIASRRYWNPQRPSGQRIKDTAEGMRHHLDQAVRAQLRGASSEVGAQLSGGFDSSAVTTTAARLLAPSGGKVIAFTAVPRQGYDGPERRNRFNDEGPVAAATAALYPNIEHVLVRSSRYSPLSLLDRHFFLQENPLANNTGNMGWGHAINDAARARKLTVILSGSMGNMTFSYHGLELLPELLRTGRWFELWRTTSRLMAETGMRRRGALVQIFGSYIPVWLWRLLNRQFGGAGYEPGKYSAIRGERLAAADMTAMAKARDLDFDYRPRRDGFAMRLWQIRRAGSGNSHKALLAGWGLEQRDPTADKRLVEYCLALPMEEYLRDGVPRSLAKRAFAGQLPEALLTQRKRGYQAADWHENLTASRAELSEELERISACAPAAGLLDIERMRRLLDDWPQSGWERDDIIQSYRLALLRGIAVGHFLRKASGANQ